MKKPLITFYGDDLTGSTDAMEALSLAGLNVALFMNPTDSRNIDRLSNDGQLDAIGLAGTSRSQTPSWMRENLPLAFKWLQSLGGELCHYKVCSTFDSSKDVGNIGCALKIGAAVFDQKVVPLVIGVPQLRRYTYFGNLYAGFKDKTYRIDRHPVMSNHPVTPMDEADVGLHLMKQESLDFGLIDNAQVMSGSADQIVDRQMQTNEGRTKALLFDVHDIASQHSVGYQLSRLSKSHKDGLFVVGSSGIEYAMNTAWTNLGAIKRREPEDWVVGAVSQIAVVSGSCSEVTAQQIRRAGEDGFTLIHVQASKLGSASMGDAELDRVTQIGIEAIDQGKSVVAYTALGADSMEGAPPDPEPHGVGKRLGRLLATLIRHGKLQRAVIAGGDTSSHALREMEIYALSLAMPLPKTPGSPLCRAHSEVELYNGMQLAFKGGQIGGIDYFSAIREGQQ